MYRIIAVSWVVSRLYTLFITSFPLDKSVRGWYDELSGRWKNQTSQYEYWAACGLRSHALSTVGLC